MSIFDRLFPSDDFEKVGWKTLENMEELEGALKRSFEQPIAIFKHSIRCGTSAQVKDQLFSSWDINPEDVELYYLDLITYRAISNEVSTRLGVMHQSPQMIIVKNGKAVASDSHYQISLANIKAAV